MISDGREKSTEQCFGRWVNKDPLSSASDKDKKLWVSRIFDDPTQN